MYSNAQVQRNRPLDTDKKETDEPSTPSETRPSKDYAGPGVDLGLAVFRSLKHIYAQLINDELGVTVVEASTLSPRTEREHFQMAET